MATRLYSFGYRHGTPGAKLKIEEGARVIDVRRQFNRNPYHNKSLRKLRGDHPDVEADILRTPQFAKHYVRLKRLVEDWPGPVYLGCTGGHHRSVYLCRRLGLELGLVVTHLNYDDP
jgi:RNase adaptor protein for sRNA GlmZ degradation